MYNALQKQVLTQKDFKIKRVECKWSKEEEQWSYITAVQYVQILTSAKAVWMQCYNKWGENTSRLKKKRKKNCSSAIQCARCCSFLERDSKLLSTHPTCYLTLLLLLPFQSADRRAVTALTEGRGRDLRAVLQMLILAHMP